MKYNKVVALFALVGTFVSVLCGEAKYYEIKSGVIEYAISGGGNVMGMQNETSGKRKVVFDEWGTLQIQKEERVSTVMGRAAKINSMTKMDHGTVYMVDLDKKLIVKQSLEMPGQSDGQDMLKMGKEMFEKMGGKKTGSGSVLGYDCEIWEAMGTKMWIHKGVILKIQADVMGIKHTEEATSVKFNVLIDSGEFDIPDFPVKSLEEVYGNDLNRGAPGRMPTQEELKQMQEMMKNLQNMQTN
ncbi:MAG: hypothetical protein QG564_1426 [Campylobacterota bacterium]|nr:hypothetical protein [Campylobacterota bacterium]